MDFNIFKIVQDAVSDDEGFSFTKALPIIISALSLVIASLSSWNNLFRPARISMQIPNRISVWIDPFNTAPNVLSYALGFVAIFLNKGANMGVVDDLLISIKNLSDNNKFYYRPYIEFEKKNNSQVQGGFPANSAFRNFHVKGRESQLKEILFRQIDGDPMPINAGKFEITVYLKRTTDKTFLKELTFNFELTKDDIDALKNKSVTPVPQGGFVVNVIERNKPILEHEDLVTDFINKN